LVRLLERAVEAEGDVLAGVLEVAKDDDQHSSIWLLSGAALVGLSFGIMGSALRDRKREGKRRCDLPDLDRVFSDYDAVGTAVL
ncbi:MAG: hypothetical protein JNM43_01245, partial [Planctomycetaceae bacterium]|nr:hypothetical protein [Planctomycetaceae bacterium]